MWFAKVQNSFISENDSNNKNYTSHDIGPEDGDLDQ
jgi:hypothetical protein